jgi:hypothetical protein
VRSPKPETPQRAEDDTTRFEPQGFVSSVDSIRQRHCAMTAGDARASRGAKLTGLWSRARAEQSGRIAERGEHETQATTQ